MRKLTLAMPLTALFLLSACTTNDLGDSRGLTKTQTGALIGTASGAALGAIINHKNRGKGALIGAVGGGLAGAAVGNYMDRQKQDLEKNLKSERDAGNVSVQKLPGDVVKITMTSQTAFDVGQADIKPGFRTTLDKLADVIIRYQKTSLTIIGHTDAQGAHDSNMELSRRRAAAVADYLQGKNVNAARLDAEGRGETEPVASNDTDAGRRANRRVEILVEPVRAE